MNTKRFVKWIMITAMVTVNGFMAKGQDIEKVLKADSIAISYWKKLLATDPLVVSGTISARSVYQFGTSGTKPFSVLLNGNAALDIFGYNVPMSFSYSSKNIDYQLASPVRINRLKFNPRYKWVQLHFGQSSMSFSPYTLSGMQFTGIGAEFSPKGPFKASVMYGKLFDAVQFDPENSLRQPVYERTGTGFKVGWQKKGYQIESSLFAAADKKNSLVVPVDTFLNIAPLQNVAYSITGRFTPLKAVSLEAEYASSAVNLLYRNKSLNFGELLWGQAPGLSRFAAYKLAINFSPKWVKFGFSMEHIDPEFKTLGAYYSRGDFQNITLNGSSAFFKSKVSLSGNLGIEKDNLKNLKLQQNTRMVGALNLGIQASKKWNIALNYSNFQSYSNIRNQFDYISPDDPYQHIDTLKFSQINQTAAMNVVYSIVQTKEESQRLMLFFTMNETNSGQQGTTANTAVVYYNCNTQWTMSKPKNGFTGSVSFNSALTQTASGSRLIAGPVVSARMPLLGKKIMAGLNLALNNNYIDRKRSVTNFNVRSSVKYSIAKNQDLSFDLYLLNRMVKDKPALWSGNISLSYSIKMDKFSFFKPIRPAETEIQTKQQ